MTHATLSRCLRLLVPVALAFGLVAGRPAHVLAQTSGAIAGVVVDAQNQPLAGATVVVGSPALQGSRTTTTDALGQYRLPGLSPGVYVLSLQPSGERIETITVHLGETTLVRVTRAAQAQGAAVGAAQPDVRTSAGVSSTDILLTHLPLGRDFYAMSRLAPGVLEDAVGGAAHGSTGAENVYLVEGLNVTGILAGEQQQRINWEFVDQVNVRSQGLPSRYGRTTGGVLETTIKSGGNTFGGGLFTYAQFAVSDETGGRRPQTATEFTQHPRWWDAGGDVGGFILPDQLWFFGGYDIVRRRAERVMIRPVPNGAAGTPEPGDLEAIATTTNIFVGKVTYRPRNNHSIVTSFFGDPTTSRGAIFPVQGPPTTFRGTRRTGGIDGIARYNFLFLDRWLFEAAYGRHNETLGYEGPGRDVPLVVDLRLSPSRSSGGFGFHRDLDQHRDHWQVALTTDEGPHTIEGGVDLERVVSVANSRHGGGGQQIHIFRSGGVDFYRHRYYVDDLAPDFDPANQATWRLLDPFASRAFDYNTALYVQDRFRAAPNLTIDAGLRWERQDLYGRGSRKVVSLSGNWALRLGAVFDPTNEGRTRIIGYYGRYFESVPMDINLRSFGRELTCFCYNFSADPDDLAPVGGPPRFSSLLSSAEEVDAPLRGQYLDEYVAAIEHRMAPSIVVAARFNQRRIGRVIEDIITPSDEYVVVNPSEGNVGSRLTFFDYDTAPAPPPRRTNTSLELSGIKHFSDGWQVLASYVVSRLSGNYDGTFQAATGQLDPNITLAYDFGDFLINADGPLTTDRRHQFKLDGSYSWSEGLVSELTAGLSVRYLSGTPRTAYGYSFIYQSWEYFLTPRGSLGRNPAYWEADLHADYPVRVGGQSIQVTFDVFNLFNRQAITVYDQRYNLSSQGPCGGVPFSICNGDNGLQHEGATFAPLSQLADPLATAPNPDFLSAGQQFTSPLSVRIGARLRF